MTLLRVIALIFLWLSGFSDGVGVVQNNCKQTSEGGQPLNVDIKPLLTAYKIAGTKTDWMKEKAVLFTEISASGETVLRLADKNSTLTYTFSKERIVALNYSSDASKAPFCAIQKEVKPLELPAILVSSLKLNDTSVIGVVNSIVTGAAQEKRTGVIVSSFTTSGVEGVNWVSCFNNTDNSTIQIEVVFAGDKSIKPASPAFNNPLILFVRFSHFKEFTASELLESVSFNIDRYESQSEAPVALAEIPKGVACEGWVQTNLPLAASDVTSAVVEFNEKDKPRKTVEVFQSLSGDPVTKIAFDPIKDGEEVPFLGYKLQTGAAEVIHDFKRGYFFALNSIHCAEYGAIPSSSADVKVENFNVKPKPFNEIILGALTQFGAYGQEDVGGKSGEVYRTVDEQKNTVEVIVVDGKIAAMNIYKEGALSPASSTKIVQRPVIPRSHPIARGRECFMTGKPKNSTVTLKVAGKSLDHVHFYGEEQVTFALADALSNIGLINILRVNAFYNNNPDDSLGITLSVFEKTDRQPANTTSFNYKNEILTSDLFSKLNETLKNGDWHFSVQEPNNKNAKTEDFSVEKGSMSQYPIVPPDVHPYQGYSGGSMFVLGIFSLLFGCAIGAGSLFFVTRRQRVSALAYQVFE